MLACFFLRLSFYAHDFTIFVYNCFKLKRGSLLQHIPHVPVLYREVVKSFEHIDEGVVVDCTMGYGGHSSLLLQSNPNIQLVGIDQDKTAIEFSTKRLAEFGDRVQIVHGRFASVIGDVIEKYGNGAIKGVLADIGVSSLQLDQKDRGFSFESDALDMRMDQDATLDAATVLHTYSAEQLQKILSEYGEIKNARSLARAIVERRPFGSAKELVQKLSHLLPKHKKIHPATLLMQAIRIEVNDELAELRNLLQALEDARLQQARIAIISFHSLEDRIVKQRFSAWAKRCICPPEAMRCECGNNHQLGKIVTKKPITAQPDELEQNSRSRSAKMRIFDMEAR